MGDTINLIEVRQYLDGSFELYNSYEEKFVNGIVTKKEMNKELNKMVMSINEAKKEYTI